MGQEVKIKISSELDVIYARLRARKIAMELGFNTVDQARISLAVSDLARALTESQGWSGEILIDRVDEALQSGIQVTVLTPRTQQIDPTGIGRAVQGQANGLDPNHNLTMMDEYRVDDQDEQETRVTLVKWLGEAG
jgi:serine/threonine-protein kinase RsbT